jgi:hypothetical protein
VSCGKPDNCPIPAINGLATTPVRPEPVEGQLTKGFDELSPNGAG